LPIGLVIDSLTDCTIGVWVNWTGFSVTNDWQRIFDFGSGRSVNMFLTPSIGSGGAMRFAIEGRFRSGLRTRLPQAVPSKSGWHHVAVTIDSMNTHGQSVSDGQTIASSTHVRNKLERLRPIRSTTGSAGRSMTILTFRDIWMISRFSTASCRQEEIMTLRRGGGLGSGTGLPAHSLGSGNRRPSRRHSPLDSGAYANRHHVYFGDDYDAVLNADIGSPLRIGFDLIPAAYVPGRLEFGRRYYWRVDEVNAPPDNTVFKGDVWSFTIEPDAYPLSSERITATASSSVPVRGPERTIDGSGMDAEDRHSTVVTDMWLTAKDRPCPPGSNNEFDKPYTLKPDAGLNYNGESFPDHVRIQGGDH